MKSKHFKLSQQLGEVYQKKGLRIALAESCTGGGVAAAITDISGCSAWFNGGMVTYSNEVKESCLQVEPALLEVYGAVSEEVAGAMAAGVLKAMQSDISLSISGIAGPSGGSDEKPVGMVCFAIADTQKANSLCKTEYFKGDRQQVRDSATDFALQWLIEYVKSE